MATLEQMLQEAIAYHQAQHFARAEQLYRQILAAQPNEPTAMQLLGVLAHQCGHNQAAVELITRAIAIAGANAPAEFYNNLGEAYRALGQVDGALHAYQTAIALNPNLHEPQKNIAIVFAQMGQISEAIARCDAALRLEPNDAGVHNNLGNLMLEAGRVEDAVAQHRQALELEPGDPLTHSNLLRDMNYLPHATADELAAAHHDWWLAHGASVAARSPAIFGNSKDPQRRLRIGYISPDFREHAVAYFILPILQNHDRAGVEVTCYAELRRPDAYTQKIQSTVDRWRVTAGWSDDEFAQHIREDGIDLLIDLAGHTESNRLPVFARRPAPVQISYLGYPLDTGAETIDCRLSDAFVDPPIESGDQHERVCRMTLCAWCYSPPDLSLPIAPRGDGPITFGSFNFLAKINDDCIAAWSRILQQMPDSKLALKSRGFSDPPVRAAVLDRFAAHGIAPSRIDFFERKPVTTEHLLQYGQIDIALDPFPYNGTTTTCEAMWMGVPVVTLAGTVPHARVGISLLSNVGLKDLIAHNPDQYVEIATTLARDGARRRDLRSTLRQRMEASPLMDAHRGAREIERVFRERWIDWCLKQA